MCGGIPYFRYIDRNIFKRRIEKYFIGKGEIMKITIQMGIVYMIGAIGDTFDLLIMLIQCMSQFYDGRSQNSYRHYKGNKNEQSFLEVVHHKYKSNQGILS